MTITRKDLRFIGGACLLGIFLAGLIIGAAGLGPLAELERRIDDVAVAHFTPAAAEPHPSVAIVAIDEATVRAYPPFSPINRAMLGRLLKILEEAEPRAIGLDILLVDPTTDKVDQRLAERLRESKVPVVIATSLEDGRLLKLAPPFDSPEIRSAPANLPVDRSDGVLRLYQSAYRDSAGTLRPSLAARLAILASGDEIDISTEPRPIAWYGRLGQAVDGSPAVATFPAHALLSVPAAAKLLRGKIVLVGATFGANGDFVKSPFARLSRNGSGTPGVMMHAQVVAQLVDGRARAVPSAALEALLIVGALVFSATLVIVRPSAIAAIGLAVLVPLLWILAVLVVRQEWALTLPALSPALAFGAGVGAFSAYQARRLDRMQRQAIRALAQRVPAGVIDQMVASPDLLRIEGDARVVSVLFTDLAGFTHFSSGRTAADVMRFLRDYLEVVSDTVLSHGGTLDKFIGDAVMAFWGAPLDDPEHASRAITCARELDERCRALAAEHGLATRIGVHSGSAMVGFLGSRERLEYTAIGDTVNTASRVESANKHLGTTLCVTRDAVEATGDTPAALGLRRLGPVRLAGLERPTTLYTPIPANYDVAALGLYERAVTALELGELAEARRLFGCLSPDEVVQFQLSRCARAGSATVTLADK